MLLRSRIAGLGAHVPPKVVTNDDLTEMMETSDEWIVQRTGIKERRWVDEKGMACSELAMPAVDKALKDAKIAKEELDLIVFATSSPDYQIPGSGCLLQARLGLSGIPALDIRQACTGFLYAISIADQYIRTGTYKKILVVGAEVQSIALNKTTAGRNIAVLFGDGAGAVVLEGCEASDLGSERFISSVHLHADGSGALDLWGPAPGSGLGRGVWIDHQMIDDGLTRTQMNGKKVFVAAVKRMVESIQTELQFNRLSLSDIDLFFFHQANKRINDTVAEQLGIAPDKVYNTIHKYGNTTAATIPLGMFDAVQAGKLKPGMLLALSAFGAGYTWGSAILRY